MTQIEGPITYFFIKNERSNIGKSGDLEEAIKLMYFQQFTSAIAHEL